MKGDMRYSGENLFRVEYKGYDFQFTVSYSIGLGKYQGSGKSAIIGEYSGMYDDKDLNKLIEKIRAWFISKLIEKGLVNQ